MEQGSLDKIRVLDITRVLSGPFCTMILADLGAEVIKIEMPGIGDDTRTGGPFVKGESTYFHAINRNKKGVTLNLKTTEGQSIFKELVKTADIVVENFTPGTMKEFGIDYLTLSEINPRLIMASISGFGQANSPYAGKVAYDPIAQAMGGLASVNGYPDGPPTKAGIGLGDLSAALWCAIGVCAAIYERTISGKGQHIDVAMTDSIFSILEHAVLRYTATGEVSSRIGNRHPTLAPFNFYQTKNGWITVATASSSVANRLADAIGRSDIKDDPRYATNYTRSQNYEWIEEIINEYISQYTKEEIIEHFSKFDVPVAPIYTIDEAVNDPHYTERGMIVTVNHAIAGPMKLCGPTIKFSRTPCKVDKAGPVIGEHNKEVYEDFLGLKEDELKRLGEMKVI